MATSALIPVSEYLSTTYRPDCDYVDGEVQERNMGERDHGDLQGAVYAFLRSMRTQWNIQVALETRVQVRADRYRIPDVCVLPGDAPKEQIIQQPPLLCIAVLSPEDRVYRVRDRIHDFLAMGVRQVWVLDPETRTAIVYDGSSIVEHRGDVLRLPGTEVQLNLTEAFSSLDE